MGFKKTHLEVTTETIKQSAVNLLKPCRFMWVLLGAYHFIEYKKCFNFMTNASFLGFVQLFWTCHNQFLSSSFTCIFSKKNKTKQKRLPWASQLPGAGHQQKQGSIGKSLHGLQWVNYFTNAPRKWSHTAIFQRLKNNKARWSHSICHMQSDSCSLHSCQLPIPWRIPIE